MTAALCPNCQEPLSGSGVTVFCPRCTGRLLLNTAAAFDDAEDMPSRKLALRVGEYELGAELGRGAMGVVYRARQPRLRREVAVKVILASRFVGETARKRFLAEAELAAQLDHPNIVPIYEVGETPDGPYYAMKLIEGGTLLEGMQNEECRMKKQSAPSRAAPFLHTSFSLLHFCKLAHALHHAHQRGVLHRDLKPGNILLDAQGEPHIADFGLARQLGAESSLTLTGSSLGTPAYMAPEQAAGERGVTTAADIWSLGAMLFHLLTGRPPFSGPTATDVLLQVRTQEPPRPRSLNTNVPADLETICLKCLEKNPARRYSSARRLAEDLERWQRHEPIEARPVSSVERLGKWVRRHPARAAVIVAFHVLLLLGAGGVLWQWRRAEQNAQHARTRLLQMHLLNVQHSFNEGDPLGALPWLASALQNEIPGSPLRAVYQLSFANALRAAVLPARMWFLPGHACGVQVSTDGCWLAAYSSAEKGMVWRMDTGEPVVPADALQGAWSLAFSPDARRLVIGASKGAFLHELPSGRLVNTLPHDGPAGHFAFSADSKWLATGDGNGMARVWSGVDGAPVTEPLRHANLVNEVSFAPDGRLLTVDREHALVLWELPSGREILRRGGEFFWQARFSPDGKRIVASLGTDARVYDGATLQPISELMRHAALITQVFFSPGGTRVVTASKDGTARIWDATSGAPVSPPLIHNLEVCSVAFSPDGGAVATGSLDLTARVWDATTGQPLTPWLRHGALVNGVCFTPDASHLVTGSDDGAVRLWPLRLRAVEGLQLADPRASLKKAWASANGSHLVAAESDRAGRVGIWSLAAGDQLRMDHPLEMLVRHARFSPDARRLLLAGERTAYMLRLSEGVVELDFRVEAGDGLHIEWHPRGHSFFTASERGQVVEWDAATGVQLRELPHGKPLSSIIRASLDGRQLAGAHRGSVQLWKLETGELHNSSELGGSWFQLVRFSRDGRLLAAGTEDGVIGLLDTESVVWRTAPLAHPGWILDLDFSPDSCSLAVAVQDGGVRIRDTRTGQLWGAPLRPPGGANRGRFSPDGRLLGTASSFTSQVWDVVTGGPVTPLFRYPHRLVEGPVFSPDSRSVFFVTEDARLIRHRLDAPDWPAEAWQLAARFLSGHAVSETGALEPWKPGPDAASAWEQLRQRLQKLGSVDPDISSKR